LKGEREVKKRGPSSNQEITHSKSASAPMKGIKKTIGIHQRIPPFVFDPPKLVKITT